MARTVIKYISRETDRHGNLRLYFRRKGKRIRLRAEPDSSDFLKLVSQASERMGARLATELGQQEQHKSYVYFVLTGNKKRVKIGIAKDPRRRFNELKTGIPGAASLYYATPGTQDLEQRLHRVFAADRTNGEWFIYSKQIRGWIEADKLERKQQRDSAGDTVQNLTDRPWSRSHFPGDQ